MLIPSIDLRNGRVVQLVQGERLALEDPDLDAWIRRFARFPKLQLIDLDAAIGTGSNDGLVEYVCAQRVCRVGGGIRTVERAKAVLGQGASHVIVGSSLFAGGRPDLAFAATLAQAVGADRVIAAVDAKGGHRLHCLGMHLRWRATGAEGGNVLTAEVSQDPFSYTPI